MNLSDDGAVEKAMNLICNLNIFLNINFFFLLHTKDFLLRMKTKSAQLQKKQFITILKSFLI